ncbi:TRAP transporter small permease [Roseibium album]|uniref:TRAP transporter small permease protein n=1 Tax=Roseibium album TaxID=311410 RepID=A0A0M7AZW4_9HYPH|nr:TRAP transporter small permease subunit [Roseibium album]MBG6161587.1 TRAP-type C4-dicarboxylate transport system permease small subunit [Labrenzia sp. EL_195]MCR9057976.1 TRAP transporter small permease subunit [Paracoccaceae bacterium]CTQ61371.1 TRAP-type C4-dicarboxylate transport system, small permease component [Roseibium album]CTQ68139.1 TRAP-type C4-dicarboxylate transport system, small permease component [Roseibium album]CTQ79273.1 TRAP-type C4-dicarboxylate transport system, small 
MKVILKVHRSLELLCRIGVFVAFMVLILAVLTQVLGRTIGDSPVWTEELTRFALIYMTALGVGLGLMSGDLVNVDIVCDTLPDPWPRILRLVASLATAFLAAILLPGAWKYVQIGLLQKSPAMGLQMSFIHFSVFLLFLLLLAFAMVRAVLTLLSADEADMKRET